MTELSPWFLGSRFTIRSISRGRGGINSLILKRKLVPKGSPGKAIAHFMWREGFLTRKYLAAWMGLIYSLKAPENEILTSRPVTLIQCIRNEQSGRSHPGVAQVNHPVEALAAADSDTHPPSVGWSVHGVSEASPGSEMSPSPIFLWRGRLVIF